MVQVIPWLKPQLQLVVLALSTSQEPLLTGKEKLSKSTMTTCIDTLDALLIISCIVHWQ